MNEPGMAAAAILDASRSALARDAVSRMLEANPRAADSYSAGGFFDLASDTQHRLAVLAEALACGEDRLLTDYLAWLKVALVARGVAPAHLAANLDALTQTVEERLPHPARDACAGLLRRAAARLPQMPVALASELPGPPPLQDERTRLLLALLEEDLDAAGRVAAQVLARGASLAELARDLLMPVQREIGRMWQMDEVSVSEEHVASVLVDRLWTTLHAAAPRRPANGHSAAVATVSGDTHAFGTRAVADCLDLDGWRVRRYGIDLPAVSLRDALLAQPTDVVCLGITMELHLRELARAVQAVRDASRRLGRGIAVLVGGGPLARIPDLWQVVGADATSTDAAHAVATAAALVAAAR